MLSLLSSFLVQCFCRGPEIRFDCFRVCTFIFVQCFVGVYLSFKCFRRCPVALINMGVYNKKILWHVQLKRLFINNNWLMYVLLRK